MTSTIIVLGYSPVEVWNQIWHHPGSHMEPGVDRQGEIWGIRGWISQL